MLPLGQPTCLTIPLEGRSPFQMNVTGKSWRQCGQIPTGMLRESLGAMRSECRITEAT